MANVRLTNFSVTTTNASISGFVVMVTMIVQIILMSRQQHVEQVRYVFQIFVQFMYNR